MCGSCVQSAGDPPVDDEAPGEASPALDRDRDQDGRRSSDERQQYSSSSSCSSSVALLSSPDHLLDALVPLEAEGRALPMARRPAQCEGRSRTDRELMIRLARGFCNQFSFNLYAHLERYRSRCVRQLQAAPWHSCSLSACASFVLRSSVGRVVCQTIGTGMVGSSGVSSQSSSFSSACEKQ